VLGVAVHPLKTSIPIIGLSKILVQFLVCFQNITVRYAAVFLWVLFSVSLL